MAPGLAGETGSAICLCARGAQHQNGTGRKTLLSVPAQTGLNRETEP